MKMTCLHHLSALTTLQLLSVILTRQLHIIDAFAFPLNGRSPLVTIDTTTKSTNINTRIPTIQHQYHNQQYKQNNVRALHVLNEKTSEEWKEDAKLKSNFCGIFNFEATTETGEIAKDITYQANLQIKELVEFTKNSKSSSSSSKSKHSKSHDDALQAERILHCLEQLNRADTITYNLVINAFAKSSLPDSAVRAAKILHRMENFYERQMDAVKQWSLCVGSAENGNLHQSDLLDKCGIFDVEQGGKVVPSITVKPNVRTYSTVIDAYSRTANCNLEGAEAAQHLLEHLRKLYETTGDEELKPNVISYNTVINAWAKTGTRHGAETAMKLLDTMEREGIADVISFNACIHAWARCGSKESGEMAESVLKRMKERLAKAEQMNNVDEEGEYKDEGDEGTEEFNFNQSLVRPNIRTYSSVIDAWSRCNCPTAARRAQAILNEMEKVYEETGDRSIQPNTITYSTVVNAHARSRDMKNKASAALQVLKKMQHVYNSGLNTQAKPTVVTYNSVLNACATTYGMKSSSDRSKENQQQRRSSSDVISVESDVSASQSLALGIVKVLYKELTSPESEIRPDHFTYGTVLKACANLMSPGDDDAITFIREVFEQCCEDGQVSFGVCFQLRQAAPVDLYRELIPIDAMDASNGHFIIDRMPAEWSKNLNERKRSNFVKKW